MERRTRLYFLLFELSFSWTILQATMRPSTDWRPSIYSQGEFVGWFLFFTTVSLGAYIIIKDSENWMRIAITGQLGGLFVVWPTILTGKIYGIDTPNQLASIISIIETGYLDFNVYGGLAVEGAIIHTILGSKVTALPLLPLFFLPVFGIGSLSIDKCRTSIGESILLVSLATLPIGVTFWASNVGGSLHPYYAGLPLAILTIIIAYRVYDLRYRILALLLLIAVGVFHPLLFITSVPFFVILALTTRQGDDMASGPSIISRTEYVLPLAISSGILILHFQLLPSDLFLPHIQRLGLVLLDNGRSTATETICLPADGNSYHLCSAETTIFRLGIPLILLSISTSILGTIWIKCLRGINNPQSNFHRLLIISPILLITGIIMIVLATGVLQRALIFRALAVSIVVLLISTGWFYEGKRHISITSYIPSILLAVFSIGIASYIGPSKTAVVLVILGFGFLLPGVDRLVSENEHLLLNVVLILLLISTPLVIYAGPHTGQPAYTMGDAKVNQAEWQLEYTPDEHSVAVGRGGDRPTRYVDYNRDARPYVGALWRFRNTVVSVNSTQVITGVAFIATPSGGTKPLYVVHHPIDSVYLPVTYEANDTIYTKNIPVETSDIENHWKHENHVYSSNKGYDIYHIK